jgi:hypothetical protein
VSRADREQIEAAVDATFSKQKHPVFRTGSLKWIGITRWGFYVDLFFQISQGENASLAMGPGEWIRCWDEHPRLMTILRIVQSRVRYHLSDRADKMIAEAKRKRHG